MCRTGGRRCPSHTDPVLVAARNKRRREAYLTAKIPTDLLEFDTPKPVSLSFQNPEEPRPSMYLDSHVFKEHKRQARELTARLDPNFDFDDEELLETYIKQREDKKVQLTVGEEQQSALVYYSLVGFRDMHDVLNDDLVGSNGLSKATEDIYAKARTNIAQLDSLFASTPDHYEERLLYRGMDIPITVEPEDHETWIYKNFPVGGVVSQKNYMSTSLDPSIPLDDFSRNTTFDGVSRGVIMEIITKKGIPLGKGTSQFAEQEREVLLPRETKFKIVNVAYAVPYGVDAESQDFGERTIIQMIDVSEDN